MWQHKYDNDGVLHVVPVADLAEHHPSDCWCAPTNDEDGFVVHHALDERQKFENGERKPS